MNSDPHARLRGTSQHPPTVPPKAGFVPYLLAHLAFALVLFVVVTIFVPTGGPLSFGALLLDYATVHMPVPLLLSALLSWLLTRRMRAPFWALLLLAAPFYMGALFIYEMGLLMASTQQ
ncbi:hypothetical protein B0I31_104252 [Saccharothrix carnea]|uniref:Uncharacterized protein n=1 Tax=Saccharothrix carnea TaxID=1280637 RepID=A0A2P8IBW9_SACCR|nr:hypothetical protein [Saccharothrix carnea]PSL55961.1 hypothetical protein B0I31_104252 [Saccharothrix carnea]